VVVLSSPGQLLTRRIRQETWHTKGFSFQYSFLNLLSHAHISIIQAVYSLSCKELYISFWGISSSSPENVSTKKEALASYISRSEHELELHLVPPKTDR
jgi:hypothetical protein